MARTTKNYSEIDDIRDDLDSLRNNVIELTRHLQKNGSAQAHNLLENAQDQLDNLKNKGAEQYKFAETYVKEKPAQSVAIAFAAGLVASMLMGRR